MLQLDSGFYSKKFYNKRPRIAKHMYDERRIKLNCYLNKRDEADW